MKVKAIAEFYDREAGLKLRKIDEEFDADPERAANLVYLKLAEIQKNTKKRKGGDPESPVEA